MRFETDEELKKERERIAKKKRKALVANSMRWANKHPEKYREIQKTYKKNNREKINAYYREYYHLHREKINLNRRNLT